MGRPKVGVPVLIRLPVELILAIDVRAGELDITRPELIRRALTQHLAEGSPTS
jgi:hypothetical protein